MDSREEVVKTSINMRGCVRDYINKIGVTASEFINELTYSYINGDMKSFELKYPLHEKGKPIKIDLSVKGNNRFPTIEVLEGKGLILFYRELDTKDEKINCIIQLIIKIYGIDEELMFLEIPAHKHVTDDYEKDHIKLQSMSNIYKYKNLDELGDDIDANENHSLRNLTWDQLALISNNYYKDQEVKYCQGIVSKLYDLNGNTYYKYV